MNAYLLRFSRIPKNLKAAQAGNHLRSHKMFRKKEEKEPNAAKDEKDQMAKERGEGE